jgi:hypothetical protein
LYPEKAKNLTVVFGTLPSIIQTKDQILAVAKTIPAYGGFNAVAYDIANQDWSLIAEQVKQANAGLVSFVGEPANMSKFSQALKDRGVDAVVFADANEYDQVLIDSSGAPAVEGSVVRIGSHPFEEASKWPATKQMVDLFAKYNPDGKLASLSVQSFSSWLLFAQSAKACAASGPITRECVLAEAKKVHAWTGGGLHAESDPGAGTPPKCSMLLQVKNGKFGRLAPELGSKDDEKDGFSCAGGIVAITGDFGQGKIDPTRAG